MQGKASASFSVYVCITAYCIFSSNSLGPLFIKFKVKVFRKKRIQEQQKQQQQHEKENKIFRL